MGPPLIRGSGPYKSSRCKRYLLLVSCVACDDSAKSLEVGIASFHSLHLELQEHRCPVISVAGAKVIDLRPLDMAGILPLAARPGFEYVARSAAAHGSKEPTDLLLDSRASDLWMPCQDMGGMSTPLMLIEQLNARGCKAALGGAPASGSNHVLRFEGSPTIGVVDFFTKPRPLHFARAAFVGMAHTAYVVPPVWRGVFGLGRPHAARAGYAMIRSFADSGGRAVSAIIPRQGSANALLTFGSNVGAVCEGSMAWSNAQSVAGVSLSEWATNLQIIAGSVQWTGIMSFDFMSDFLIVPHHALAQFLVALLGHDGAGRCVQSYQPSGNQGSSSSGFAGLILCPCDAVTSRPPLELKISTLRVALPWSALLQPVQGEAGMCTMHLHGVEGQGVPNIGIGLLASVSVVAFDFDSEKIGACVPKQDAASVVQALSDGWQSPGGTHNDASTSSMNSGGTLNSGSPPLQTQRGNGPQQSQSWLAQLGPNWIAALVILIAACPAIGFSIYKHMQKFQYNQTRRCQGIWQGQSRGDQYDDSDMD